MTCAFYDLKVKSEIPRADVLHASRFHDELKMHQTRLAESALQAYGRVDVIRLLASNIGILPLLKKAVEWSDLQESKLTKTATVEYGHVEPPPKKKRKSRSGRKEQV